MMIDGTWVLCDVGTWVLCDVGTWVLSVVGTWGLFGTCTWGYDDVGYMRVVAIRYISWL